MKTKSPASPSGLVFFYYLYRGLHPPLYPDGLSGLTMKFLYIELGLNRAMQTILVNIHEKNNNAIFSDFCHGICLF